MSSIDANPAGPAIVWFRNDLRLSDNPALSAAISSGKPVLAVYIYDPDAAGLWARGGASKWWLHQSLESLDQTLRQFGGRLVLKSGDSGKIIRSLIQDTGATSVLWNRRYEPWAIKQDKAIKEALQASNIEVKSFNGSLLVEPWAIANKQGLPFRVFTPFWKTLQAHHEPERPLGSPSKIAFFEFDEGSTLDELDLLPQKPDWAGGLRQTWTVGEPAARDRLARFIDTAITGYKDDRNLPGVEATSRLSPHLHFGEISPRQVWHAVKSSAAAEGADAHHFLSEIAWREFSYSLLFNFPGLPDTNFQDKFDRFEWRDDPAGFERWSKGLTGFPIVDAGMRELWHTGWMHNRVRMIVASFLTKDLMIDWRLGKAWFWDTLVDADLANNAASWQWTAGSGADAAPYFRVFNPTTQAQKFDPKGAYVKKWVPELRDMPDNLVHDPEKAGGLILSNAKIDLGQTYPEPIVDHAQARLRALDAFATLKEAQ